MLVGGLVLLMLLCLWFLLFGCLFIGLLFPACCSFLWRGVCVIGLLRLVFGIGVDFCLV